MSFPQFPDGLRVPYHMSVSPYSRHRSIVPTWLKTISVLFITWLFTTSILTWSLMIIIGIVHAQVLPAVIPAGFGALFPLAMMVAGFIGAVIAISK